MRITLNSTKEALETTPDFKYADDKRRLTRVDCRSYQRTGA